MTPSRRRVLRGAAAVPALGITTLRLPAATAATSNSAGVGTVADGPLLTPDDTRVVVSWAETDGATYTVQQDDGAGGWTDVATEATSPTTVTGLTNDVLVTFRIVSESGGVTFEGAGTSTRPRAAAVGGTESVIDVGGQYWRVHAFTAAGSSNLTFRAARAVEYLIVGGGGAGGGGRNLDGLGGGGGGGGGLRTNVGGTTVPSGVGDLTVVVGAGGVPVPLATGGDGGPSSALGVTAEGGGGGGGGIAAGRDGGSGGGGSGFTNSDSTFTIGAANDGGTGTSGQGSRGGDGNIGNGGGGGGAEANGTNATTSAAGVGGSGSTNGITGASAEYASGGSGASSYGGNIREFDETSPGTGNGGRGATYRERSTNGSTGAGGSGASGAVVIRYLI